MLKLGTPLVLLAALTGCIQNPLKPAPVVSAPPAQVSPLVAFVAQAQPGQRAQVSDPQLGDVSVMVEREYYAASGQVCRRFNARSAQGGLPESLVACREEQGWTIVRLPQSR